ncbi:hypothetical protein [Allorhodopirellula heiligendammensis]|uniref:Uncharacterized protein n=1 Tax=Allorhodopirellula heiligendammensis TaxID=2714739 RepID=A0A5C6C3L5_9BACT|nr:hypothetical protein [Allorhodopirellula heiligendammensis]TWU18607.1 hypothetical protein Poly21_07710 [Allorhodopirellula heiligendammensis]
MPRQTIQQQIDAFTSERRLSIAHPLQRYLGSGCCASLPRHAKLHWRGLLQPKSGAVNGRWMVDERLLPTVPPSGRKSEFEPHDEAILCHCKPLDDTHEKIGSENRYPDIPDRWDIYLLMRHQYNAIAFTGKKIAAVIRRTPATHRTILNLRDWETDPAGGRYRRTRVKSQLRRRLGRIPYPHEIERAHAKTALIHLGFKLPGKPKERHGSWPGLLKNLGFEVEITKGIGPTPHVAMSTKMISAYRERYPDREGYV